MPKPLCFTRPNGLREKKEPKRGPSFFKKRCASAALGAFWEPGRAGNGKRVWFGVLCEHLRAFALVSQKPVRGRTGAGARTNSPSREPDEAQKALEAQRRENIFDYSPLFVRRAKNFLNIHHLLVMD